MRIFALGKRLINVFTRSKAATKTGTLAMQRQEAQRFISDISEDSWQKISRSVFQQKGEAPSQLVENLQSMRKYIADNSVTVPEEVAQALNELEHKSSVLAERLNKSISKGIEPLNSWKYGQKFEESNKKALTIVKDFFEKEESNLFKKELDYIRAGKDASEIQKSGNSLFRMRSNLNSIYSNNLFNSKIGNVSDDILQSGQKFYHGTKHARSIKRQGFSLLPKKMQAELSARELGEGIYLTPDRNVAARFAGLRGNIMHADVKLGKVAAVNDSQIMDVQRAIYSEIGEIKDSHKIELIIKELFKRNGYNAAYSRQALGNHGLLTGNLGKANDILCGGRQSQLVAFDTGDVSILSKSIRERLQNELLQLKTFVKFPFQYVKAQREMLF